MTTPTPRWTAETEELVRAICFDAICCAPWGPTTEYDIENAIAAGHIPDDYDPEAAQHEAERYVARAVLEALTSAGVLTAVGGETRPIWRTRNLTSGGSSVHWTRESADAAMAFRSRPGVPWDPPPDPYVLETAEQTACADGTVITSPWREVTDDPA